MRKTSKRELSGQRRVQSAMWATGGLSWQSCLKWGKRFKEHGLKGLRDIAPKGGPAVITPGRTNSAGLHPRLSENALGIPVDEKSQSAGPARESCWGHNIDGIKNRCTGGAAGRLATALMICLLVAVSLPSVLFAGQPCGIYVLDNFAGKRLPNGMSLRDANIRSYGFIEGYAWRWSWAAFQPERDVYDFSALDAIVRELEKAHKHLSLILMPMDPAFLSRMKGVTTWSYVDNHPRSRTYGQRITKVVPWDPVLRAQFRTFMAKMASHEVYSRTAGRKVHFRDLPILTDIVAPVPGWGALREFRSHVVDLPGYARGRFQAAVVGTYSDIRAAFPSVHIFVPLWRMRDNIRNPSLGEDLYAALKQIPNLSLWQDNLAARKSQGQLRGFPNTRFAALAYASRTQSHPGFQMLESWARPFANPWKTHGTTIGDAIGYAYKTYNCRYVEVYVADADKRSNWPALKYWNSKMCGK